VSERECVCECVCVVCVVCIRGHHHVDRTSDVYDDVTLCMMM
jgi:hypothetical protein